MILFAAVDPHFAKEQLLLLLREWYMHPNGQLPAYEWNFSDVNPPVHAWAVWRVYKIADPKGRLAQWLKDPKLSDETLVQSLYRLTFARPATPAEVETARALIAEAPSRAIGAQDLFWGLLNSKEFLFNH